TRLHLLDPGADLEHLAAALMAEQMREEAVLALAPGDLVNLLAADAAVIDLDQHLPDIELRQFDLVDVERRILPDQYRSLHKVTPESLKRRRCCRLFEIDEPVIAGIAPFPVQPQPFVGRVKAHAS